MNAVVKSPVETFRAQVLPPEKSQDLWRALPSHIKPAVFERNLVNALMQNPDLLNFQPALVYREVSKAAGLGLLLDPLLGEAYMVVAYNYKTKRQEPQLRVGYKGMLKLARQTGDVEAIYAHEVCARDKIQCHQGTDKKLTHEPLLFSDRGPVIGYYAVIKFKDGAFDFEPMSTKQTQAIRDRSDAWKAFKDNKIKSTPWSTDEDEMAKKTVLRRLMKRQAQSGELADAIKIEDEAEFQNDRADLRMAIDHDDGPPSPPAASGTPAIEHQDDAQQVGESVIWDETAERASIPDDDLPPELDRRNVNGKKPDQVAFDGKQWLKDLDGALAGCESVADLTDTQKKMMVPAKSKASKDDWNRAEWLVHEAFKRINQTVLDAG